MNPVNKQANQVIQHAKKALQRGEKTNARRLAEQAITLDPDREEPWLILAAIGSPKASVVYLNNALEINPNSTYARQGMHWAIKRLRDSQDLPKPHRSIISSAIKPDSFARSRQAFLPWLVVFSLLVFGVIYWFFTPRLSFALSPRSAIQLAEAGIQKSTYTPSPTSTYTPTPTFTHTPTNTPIPTSTSTLTETPLPTEPPRASNKNKGSVSLPSSVGKGEFWIDVDLTNQRVHVYQGKNLLNSFLTSTGTWRYPTVTGQYKIYVKYRYAHMSGPGYFLPNVPYVMYFYKGYGIHGTYWHNNFGTPMSHGCVNLRTDDAGWVFNRASVGTVVNIHY